VPVAHTYLNANGYTDRHANCDSDSDFDTNRDSNANDEPNPYAQGFNYTETSSDSGSPAVTRKLNGRARCRAPEKRGQHYSTHQSVARKAALPTFSL